MTINRWAAKTDPNQPEVVAGLRAAGYKVFILKRPCDLLAYKDKCAWFIEVKMPGKEKDLTKFQKEIFPDLPVIIATTAKEALEGIHGFKLPE